MHREQSPQPNSRPAGTASKLADARHFKGLASSFALFLEAARKKAAKPQGRGPFHADLVRNSYDDLCTALTDAQKLTGNQEPEMAEAVAELQRLKDEYRELID